MRHGIAHIGVPCGGKRGGNRSEGPPTAGSSAATRSDSTSKKTVTSLPKHEKQLNASLRWILHTIPHGKPHDASGKGVLVSEVARLERRLYSRTGARHLFYELSGRSGHILLFFQVFSPMVCMRADALASLTQDPSDHITHKRNTLVLQSSCGLPCPIGSAECRHAVRLFYTCLGLMMIMRHA